MSYTTTLITLSPITVYDAMRFIAAVLNKFPKACAALGYAGSDAVHVRIGPVSLKSKTGQFGELNYMGVDVYTCDSDEKLEEL